MRFGSWRPYGRQRKRSNIDDMLTGNPEHRPTGSQQLYVWTCIEEIGERRGCRQHLFKVVKHQQIVVVPQHRPESVKNRTAIGTAIGPDTESGSNGGQDECWLLHIRKIDELGSVGS